MRLAWKRLLNLAEPYRQTFERSCEAPRAAQEYFLSRALQANRNTEIGRRLGFRDIQSAGTYAARVPIVRYTDIDAELAAWGTGKPTLCAAPVEHTEWTSGSTQAAKTVPYSAAGLEGFRHALFPWLSYLCRHDPAVAAGRVYWALSPAGTGIFPRRMAANDAVYFGDAAPLLADLSAVPLALASLQDVESWRFWTALFLAASEDLSFVSIWSPTFLHPLLDTLEQDVQRITHAMRQPDRYAPPLGLVPALRALSAEAHRHSKRLHSASSSGRLDIGVLWPGLRRISCWTHGTAARQVNGLAKRLGEVAIEPKGLLSTEAAVSLPVRTNCDPVAAITSTYLELQQNDGRCLPLWAWREGDVGRMLITTRSGLWRYDTGDRVCVTGFWKRTPCLLFVGRDGQSVDLCGEKLDETLVQTRLPDRLDAFQAPAADARGYCLFLEAQQVTPEQAQQLAKAMDVRLCEILHYRHARELGQLAPLRAVRVTGLMTGIAQRRLEEQGTPLATAKIPALDADRGWYDYFARIGALEMT